jgi:organic hydroperoxide reductase OsmC/OhrA
MASSGQHSYAVNLKWTGNLGHGTSSYRAFSRDHEIVANGKPVLQGSSDPAFRGDPARYNPEDLLVASLAACHMLWYLHLAVGANLVVRDYTDAAEGTMVETADGGGHFVEVVLRPVVTVDAGGDTGLAEQLHVQAHHLCFIANSVNFPVRCEPTLRIAEAQPSSEV